MFNRNPQYDNDLVTLGYLKNVMNESGDETEQLIKTLPKSFNSPPIPPYYIGSVLYYDHQVYRCNKERLQGSFNWEDWSLVATDNTELRNWIDNTYSVDKLQLEEQIDKKIETHYQENNPSLNWTTDLEKSKHVGDYWYRTTDNTQWRYTKITTNPITYDWQQVNVPNSIFDLIDKKKSIYTSKPTSYKKDDLWIIEDTISAEDIPIGTQDNPIAKGDWVFSTADSESYNKNHWVKRDTDVSLEYLQTHYYTTSEVETKVTESERYTDSEITKAKNEINLSVSQNYATKTELSQTVSDFDEEIGTINTTIDEQNETITSLDLGVGEIRTTVGNNYQEITRKIDGFATQESIIEVQNRVSQIQSDTYTKTEINTKLSDGSVTKVQTLSGTFDINGMTYDDPNGLVKTTINQAGVNTRRKSNDETILFAGYVDENNSQFLDYKGQTIVATENILVKNYLVVGSKSRFEDYEDGTGCFYIG